MGQWPHLYKLHRWRKLRAAVLRQQPLCVLCTAEGRTALAQVVDHKVPHKGSMDLFWDRDNLQPLCYTCHNSSKQSTEVRGYDKKIDEDGWPISMAP